MFATLMLALLLVLLTTLVHGYMLAPAIARLENSRLGSAAVLILAVQGVVLIHILEASIYAIGFEVGATMGLGGFKETDAMGWMDYLYFSLVNYNTLGLGDIYPTGHLRFLAGVEALNGFLLISCSAAFIHKLMRVKPKSGQ